MAGSKKPDHLVSLLFGDIRQALDALKSADDAYHRRAVVHTMFTCIEGVTAFLKSNAILQAIRDPKLFTPAELAMLVEHTYELNDKGCAAARQKVLPPLPNLRFAYAMATKHLPDAPVLDVQSSPWQALVQTGQVRNRITHPKSSSDLTISTEEVRQARKVFLWFAQSIVAVVNAISSSVPKRPPLTT